MRVSVLTMDSGCDIRSESNLTKYLLKSMRATKTDFIQATSIPSISSAKYIVVFGSDKVARFESLVYSLVEGTGAFVVCPNIITQEATAYSHIGTMVDIYKQDVSETMASFSWGVDFSPRLVCTSFDEKLHIDTHMHRIVGKPPVSVVGKHSAALQEQEIADLYNSGYYVEVDISSLNDDTKIKNKLRTLTSLLKPGQGITLGCSYNNPKLWEAQLSAILDFNLRLPIEFVYFLSFSGSIRLLAAPAIGNYHLAYVPLYHRMELIGKIGSFCSNSKMDLRHSVDQLFNTPTGEQVTFSSVVSCNGKQVARTSSSFLAIGGFADTATTFNKIPGQTIIARFPTMKVVQALESKDWFSYSNLAIPPIEPGTLLEFCLDSVYRFKDTVRTYTAKVTGLAFPKEKLSVSISYIGMANGLIQARGSSAKLDGTRVLNYDLEIEQPKTAYIFTGHQETPAVKTGMDLYEHSDAAKRVWDSANCFMLKVYGVPLLDIVRNNPNSVEVDFKEISALASLGNGLLSVAEAVDIVFCRGLLLQSLIDDKSFNGLNGANTLEINASLDSVLHTSKMSPHVESIRNKLQTHISALHIDLSALVDCYIPNLIGKPFELSKDYIESAYNATHR
ncbi:fatty acid synthase alpha subunit Lsd1 [Coemansia sp. RSA 1804]|nr:fatty acid synthase alpha subunit Lsd1 [Coemansia sp. RSA 1804]